MDTRALAAVALAATLLLAGCSLGGSDGPGGDGSPGGTGMESPAAENFSYPAGYDENGVTNTSTAARVHRELLLSSSGFTVTYDATVTGPENTTTVAYSQRVETGSEEVLRRMDVSSGDLSASVTRYYSDDTVHVRSTSPNEDGPSFSNRSRSYQLRSFTGMEFVRPGLTDVSYGSSRLTRRGGDPVVVYSDASLENPSALFGARLDAANVSEFSATLTVGEDGVVRKLRYEATVRSGGSDRTVEVVVKIGDVGNTTVDRPRWVSRT